MVLAGLVSTGSLPHGQNILDGLALLAEHDHVVVGRHFLKTYRLKVVGRALVGLVCCDENDFGSPFSFFYIAVVASKNIFCYNDIQASIFS